MNESAQPDIAASNQNACPTLAKEPHDVESLRLLVHKAAHAAPADAEQLLRQAIALAPDFIAAYADLASLLCRLERAEDALALLDDAIAKHPGAVWPLSIKAAVFSAERRAEEALAAHKAVLAKAPHATVPWMNYAHALKTVGGTEEAVAAYREALDRDPANGSCWWGLANLRTIRFEAQDITLMEKALSGNPRDALQQVHLHFALGKGLSDLGNYEQSFRHYQEANRLRGRLVPYDVQATSDFISQSKAVFTTSFFTERSGFGCDANDAIFIVGMPRSGSTLIEQVLASHPMIEGLGELFELRNIAENISDKGTDKTSLPKAIAKLTADDLHTTGAAYLRTTRRHRRSGRPFFTDKMPANWQLIPLIHLILPNARIIDIRREPRACCLSAFTTYFNRQTSFPTSLEDMARYYADYVRMMDHMDTVLPGRIHRIRYERLVEDVETETRRLLDYLALPFDPACLRFHDNQRAVYTPSAQQVRRPINRDALDHWRKYEQWLAPAGEALDASASPAGA